MGKQLELFEGVEYNGDASPEHWQVPFVDEVQEFNDAMGKPNSFNSIKTLFSFSSISWLEIFMSS